MENKHQPTIAPGSDNLEKRATPEEIAQNDYTQVTKMALDEVDPSLENKKS
ncbi:hypothetical protein [Effusibacillus dendaii]|uniref:Uncharacterized protein n=1 Tax=Effusibacillus dendaii TaxID=2743772 RepID=A0A7I8D9I8_9BACL|nr:hypothetical protein [Effusibacillus dendaii]BCJ85486.1 hypothetical protein skT53_04710 [Effusibacillus dendaii]